MAPGSRSRCKCASRRSVAAGAALMDDTIPIGMCVVPKAPTLESAGRLVGCDDPQVGAAAGGRHRGVGHDLVDVGALEDLVAQQREGERVELVAVLADDPEGVPQRL